MSTWFSMSVRREYNGESPHAIFEEIRMLEIKFLSYFVNVSLLIIVKQKKKKKKNTFLFLRTTINLIILNFFCYKYINKEITLKKNITMGNPTKSLESTSSV
jgi:hypothetical protein